MPTLSYDSSAVEKLLISDDFANHCHSLLADSHNLPPETTQKIIDRVIKDNIQIDINSINDAVIQAHPELLKHYFKSTDEDFSNMGWIINADEAGAQEIIVENEKSLKWEKYTQTYSEEDVIELLDICRQKVGGIERLPRFFIEDSRTRRFLLDNYFEELLKSLAPKKSDLNGEMIIEIKEFFLENVDEYVYLYHDLKKLFEKPELEEFTNEEWQLVIAAARHNNRFILKEEYTSLSRDAEVVINTIRNSRTRNEYGGIIGNLRINRKNNEIEFTEEQSEKIARILAARISPYVSNEINYFVDILKYYFREKTRIFKYNPYALNNSDTWYVGRDEDIKNIPAGKFLPSRNTRIEAFYLRPDLFWKYYRNNFQEAIRYLRYSPYDFLKMANYTNEQEEEYYKELYNISLEQGYDISDTSDKVSRIIAENPFNYFNAVIKDPKLKSINHYYIYYDRYKERESFHKIFETLYEDANSDFHSMDEIIDYFISSGFYLGNTDEFHAFPHLCDMDKEINSYSQYALRCIKENFFSVLGYFRYSHSLHGEPFSLEDYEEIAEIYRGIDESTIHPSVLKILDKEGPISNNPYIMLQKYRENQSIPKHNGSIEFSDEMYKEIADLYIERKGRALLDTDLPLERSNPYIIKYSAEKDPQSIDNIALHKLKPESEDVIIECLKNRSYHFSEKTSDAVKSERIIDFIIKSGDLSNLKFVPYHYYDEYDYRQIIIARVEKEAENGDLSNLDLIRVELTDEHQNFISNILLSNVQNGEELGVKINTPLPADVRKQICMLNPNNVRYLDVQDLMDEEFIKYIVDSIRTGKITIDDNLPKCFKDYPQIMEELFRNPSNYLLVNLYNFGDSSVGKKLAKAIDEEILEVPEKIDFNRFSRVFLGEESDKVIKHIIEQRPENLPIIYFDHSNLVSKEYKQELTRQMIENIRNGQIEVADDFPIKKIKEQELIVEVIKQNPGIIQVVNWQYDNPIVPNQELKGLLISIYGVDWYDTFFPEEPSELSTEQLIDKLRIRERVKENPDDIYHINLAVLIRYYEEKELRKIALENKMILNSNCHYIFRSDPEIIIQSITLDPSSAIYAYDVKFSEEQQANIRRLITDSSSQILLTRKSFTFLRKDLDYILFSIDNSAGQELSEVVSAIKINELDEFGSETVIKRVKSLIDEGKLQLSDTRNRALIARILGDSSYIVEYLEKDFEAIKYIPFDLATISLENQEKIFQIYQRDVEKYSKDSDIVYCMNENGFYILDYIKRNPTRIPRVNFEGLLLPDEAKDLIRESYLQNNYKVTSRIPKFLLSDKEYIFRYIIQNNGKLRGLSLDDVAPLLAFSSIRKHPEYLALSKFYDQIDIGYGEYFKNWGREKTIEIGKQVGGLIKYMDPSKEPSMEALKEKLMVLLENRSDLNGEEVVSIISLLNIDIPNNLFELHPDLEADDALFEYLIERDPNAIFQYNGSNPKILIKALDSGLELTVDLVSAENFNKNEALYRRVLEKNIELFQYYQGDNSSIISLAYDKGYFSNKTPNELYSILDKNENYMKNSILFDRLITEYGVDVGIEYTGGDERIFSRLVNEGMFDDVAVDEILELINQHNNYLSSSSVFMYLLDHFGPQMIEYYRGSNEEVFQKAIDKGLNVDAELFVRVPRFAKIKLLREEGIKRDKYCVGLRISALAQDVEYNRDKILSIIESIIGEDEFKSIIDTKEKEDSIVNLCTISDSPMLGIIMLKSMNQELIKAMGFEKWKIVVKYTFNNSKAKSLSKIVENGNIQDFMSVYRLLEGYYNDQQAYGIDKFLRFSQLYIQNPELLRQLGKRSQNQGLIEKEQADLYTLLYSSDDEIKQNTTIDDIGLLTEKEAKKRQEKIESSDAIQIKFSMLSFLTGMDSNQIQKLLSQDIDSRTIKRTINRAKKSGDVKLENDARLLLVMVDALEQFCYADISKEQISKVAKNLYNQNPEFLMKVRKLYTNFPETIRQFYEHEAQSELTSLKDIVDNHPELVEWYRGVPIVDLSKIKHTIYAHVLGVSVKDFLNTERGKVTICVSPETDQHEAYYDNDKHSVRLCYDTIPTGSFIGSAPYNIGSNARISYNDYNADRVRTKFIQTGIRDSYVDKGESRSSHAETLLYREGLEVGGIEINSRYPSEEEFNVRNEFFEAINESKSEGDSDYNIIPFVRTQGTQNRVFSYEDTPTKRLLETNVETIKEERVDYLRKLFSNIFEFPQESVIRKSTTGEKYIILDDKVYTIIDDYDAREIGAMMAGESLQRIVYGDDSDIPMEVREVRDDSDETIHIAVNDINTRSLWRYSRQNQQFSQLTNSILLKEFLIDHLMINYQVGNTAFLLDEDNNIHGRDKRGACGAVNDFINSDGEIYTNMSYLYFDSEKGNNLYRKVFENYISARNPEAVFTERDFNEFIALADMISEIDDDSYLNMFNHMLSAVSDEIEKERIVKSILARKHNIKQDSRDFIERIQTLHKIENAPEVFENAKNIAFINDVHGNLPALSTLLDECEKEGKKDIFILGDMIGFGPQSNECIDLLREKSDKLNIRCILGNHELYNLMGNKNFTKSVFGFHPNMTYNIRHNMSNENRRFIESMPLTRKIVVDGERIELTHFPINEEYDRDANIYLDHDVNIIGVSSGKGQDAVIYGHEHGTESTRGDEVGKVYSDKIDDVQYINLPSSGCVHGNYTSYTTIDIVDGEISTKVQAIPYERKELVEALKRDNNHFTHFFGGIRSEGGR